MKHLDFFNNRHSVRSFSQKSIAPEQIDIFLSAAAHAPNTGNMQTVCAVATFDSEIKSKLSPCHFNQPCVTNAACIITFCIDFNRFNHWCHLNDAKPGLDNLQSFMAASIDASIFAQQFCTIAEMNGLGTVDLGTTLYNASEIAEILTLPTGVIPIITVAAGYPSADVPDMPTDRLPLQAVVHHDRYKDFSDSDIEALYHDLDNSESSKKFIAENNKATLAQVFTDIRYPKATSDAFSISLRTYLSQNGIEI